MDVCEGRFDKCVCTPCSMHTSPPLPSPPPTCGRTSSAIKRPKELVVRVELDGVETVADVDLEVFERRLELVSQKPVYKLEVGVVSGCGRLVW